MSEGIGIPGKSWVKISRMTCSMRTFSLQKNVWKKKFDDQNKKNSTIFNVVIHLNLKNSFFVFSFDFFYENCGSGIGSGIRYLPIPNFRYRIPDTANRYLEFCQYPDTGYPIPDT